MKEAFRELEPTTVRSRGLHLACCYALSAPKDETTRGDKDQPPREVSYIKLQSCEDQGLQISLPPRNVIGTVSAMVEDAQRDRERQGTKSDSPSVIYTGASVMHQHRDRVAAAVAVGKVDCEPGAR